MKILVQGWTEIPHSYAMVNCFQLLALSKIKNVEIFVDEMPYFRPEWANVKKLVYGDENNNIIKNLKKWNGQDVDVVYSITFPYNIAPFVHNSKVVPKCVFYTSEFASLDKTYFTCDFNRVFADIEAIKGTVAHRPNSLFFTAPSAWSARGMELLGVEKQHNKIISHGVDLSIFKQCAADVRKRVRRFYKVQDNEILLMNIGAMTGNKGIALILSALHQVVNVQKKKHYKILFKGTGDLYTSKGFLEASLNGLTAISKSDMENLLHNHIIFTDKTLKYSSVNELFSAADLYVSPYLAEGFNLVVLEALTAGLSVLVPTTGSTKEFVNDIYENGGRQFVHYVPSNVFQQENSRQNIIAINDLVKTILNFQPKEPTDYTQMRRFIKENYSWDSVAKQLVEYLQQHI